MRRRNLWITSLILVIVVAVAGFFGYDYYSTPNSSTNSDPTANWQTYQHQGLGLSFKYPSDWQLVLGDNDNLAEFTKTSGNSESQTVLALDLRPKLQEQPLNKWVHQNYPTKNWQQIDQSQNPNTLVYENENGLQRFIAQNSRILIFTAPTANQETYNHLFSTLALEAQKKIQNNQTNASGKFLDLTNQQLVTIFDSLKLPNTTKPQTNYPITGHSKADQHIRSIAKQRGYVPRQAAKGNLKNVGGVLLQPQVAGSAQKLLKAARKSGMNLQLVSGYRSPSIQRNLFVSRFNVQAVGEIGRTYTNAEIANGRADKAIQATLSETALPGYSKHHTGYAIDFSQGSLGLEAFGQTKAYRWLSKNDFAKAKQFGLIPSYPEGVANQGPNPEPWEFVYVGEEFLVGGE